jgi:hypothetical protein
MQDSCRFVNNNSHFENFINIIYTLRKSVSFRNNNQKRNRKSLVL